MSDTSSTTEQDRYKRNGIIAGSIVGTVIAFAGAALAAALLVTTGSFAAGEAAVAPACDTDGVVLYPNTPSVDPSTGDWVTDGVSVTGIAPACYATTNYINLAATDTGNSLVYVTGDTVITNGTMSLTFSPSTTVRIEDIDVLSSLIYKP